MTILGCMLLCSLAGSAQSREDIGKEKRDANRELNNGVRTGQNAGDHQKVNDAENAKDRVKEAKTGADVRSAVRDYRAGGEKTGADRRPNAGGAKKGN